MAHRDADVIVVGGGGAGLCAALAATEAGARVTILEASSQLGGSIGQSGGVFYAGGTAIQRLAGIDDTPAAMFRSYMTLNQHRLDAGLVRRLCDDAPDGLAWLMAHGVRFASEGLYLAGTDGVRRAHRATGRGAGITTPLAAAIQARAAKILCGHRVTALGTDPEGAVTGVVANGICLIAGAVVLATGSFGHDADLLARLYPDASSAGDMAWSIATPECRGDGIRLGEAVGADLAGHNRGLLLLTPGFERHNEPALPGWLVFVNRDGRRFIDETADYAVMSGAVLAQPGGECFGLFDDAARRACRTAPNAHGTQSYWEADRLASLAQQGKLPSAASIAELAAATGIRADTLATTVSHINGAAARGEDDRFGKRPVSLRPIATPPFYAARLRPAVIAVTSAGLRIDREARVLDAADMPIPGLFAAGETAGGVLGERYIGGLNITAGVVFGRRAGQSAARAASLSCG